MKYVLVMIGSTIALAGCGDGQMNNAVVVTVHPKSIGVARTRTQQFTCTVTGATDTTCTWSVTEANGGTITGDGLYTAPGSAGTYHVVASSRTSPASSDTATVSVILPCSDVGATVGAWQNISPIDLVTPPNMEVMAVVVNPLDESVYAAAGNVTNGGACPAGQTCPAGGTGVFKSIDCGATWARVSSTAPGSDSANLLTGDPWAMLIDPAHPENMYINNGYGMNPTIYKSTNGGTDWTALEPDPTHQIMGGQTFVQAIAMDPFDPNHLAVTFHLGCGQSAPYKWCFSHSTDAGASWNVFNGPVTIPNWQVPDAGWIEGSSISILGPTNFMVLSPDGVWYTGDTGNTWTLVIAQIDATSYAGSTHIGPDGTLFIGDAAGSLFFSAPAPGQTPPFAVYQAPTLPVPMPRLPYLTGLSPAVTEIPNSPPVTQIVDDGVNLYAMDNLSVGASFWTAPLAARGPWTQMPDKICVGDTCRGSNEMAYDSLNHIVYSANWGSGLWRLVTR